MVDAVEQGAYETRDDELGVPVRFSLASCPRCSAPLLLEEELWEGRWSPPTRLFPQSADLVSWSVPIAIRNAYAEAAKCITAKAPTAAAIMCRKTLEGVCHDHGAAGRSLVDRLRDLKDKGIIEGRLYEWSDELRLVGNEAAHDVAVEVSAEDAQDALTFTRAVLEYVYTFRDQFEQFKQRRANRTRAATSAASPKAAV